jgi:hypothetical protein
VLAHEPYGGWGSPALRALPTNGVPAPGASSAPTVCGAVGAGEARRRARHRTAATTPSDIPGATADAHTLTAAHVDGTVRAVVTATKAAGSAEGGAESAVVAGARSTVQQLAAKDRGARRQRLDADRRSG